MTQALIIGGVLVLLVVLAFAVVRWREDRKTSRQRDAVTAREQDNVTLWIAKQTKRSDESGSKER